MSELTSQRQNRLMNSTVKQLSDDSRMMSSGQMEMHGGGRRAGEETVIEASVSQKLSGFAVRIQSPSVRICSCGRMEPFGVSLF
jgi:hypothetical protein